MFFFVFSKFISVEKQVDSLLDTLPSFIEKCKRFQDVGHEINSRYNRHVHYRKRPRISHAWVSISSKDFLRLIFSGEGS